MVAANNKAGQNDKPVRQLTCRALTSMAGAIVFAKVQKSTILNRYTIVTPPTWLTTADNAKGPNVPADKTR